MAELQQLIVKQDNVEIVRDVIAAILTDEVANQKALAVAAQQDPREWELRVYLERNNPVSNFLDPVKDENGQIDQLDNPPVINIQLDNWSTDASSSNQVERQKTTAIYHIDCYGFGVSSDSFSGGHVAGDESSAKEAVRAVRLVRNILMSSYYTYLGLPRGGQQSVWRRWVDSVNVFQPQLDNRSVQNVMAARISFMVEFSEFSQQYQAMLLEIVNVRVKRTDTQDWLVAEYDYT